MIGALVAGITGSGGASLSSYESIATASGFGASGTITLSSIPATFKHLQIRGIYFSTSGSGSAIEMQVSFNGSSAANYAGHKLRGNGTTVTASGTDTGSGNGYIADLLNSSFSDTNPNVFIMDILDYASTTKNKTIRAFNGFDNNGSGQVEITSGLWINTSAITSITITNPTFNFSSSSKIALYGIKEA